MFDSSSLYHQRTEIRGLRGKREYLAQSRSTKISTRGTHARRKRRRGAGDLGVQSVVCCFPGGCSIQITEPIIKTNYVAAVYSDVPGKMLRPSPLVESQSAILSRTLQHHAYDHLFLRYALVFPSVLLRHPCHFQLEWLIFSLVVQYVQTRSHGGTKQTKPRTKKGEGNGTGSTSRTLRKIETGHGRSFHRVTLETPTVHR